MVKWSGSDCLLGPLLVLGLIVDVVVQGLFDGKQLVTDIGRVAGFVLSAILIRMIGRGLNRRGTKHTLYDAPMQNYWWLAMTCVVLTLALVLVLRL
ncbi:hypothetical protein [Amycolatopsis sp. NPDC059657]|uniref:hypothetical protein n=1 Tax=Amycolatopsis sp. NPDC059657 TaxID=3346899 RepID=UPI00366E3DC9